MSTGRAIILLAAGQSTRFGSSKTEYVLQSGKSILASAVDLYSGFDAQMSVVVQESHPWAAMDCSQPPGTNIIVARNAGSGMSASIGAGIAAQHQATAVMIALADMIYVRKDTLEQLWSAASSQKIVVPRSPNTLSEQKVGNPVIFGRHFFDQLLGLSGDIGGRQICQDNAHALHYVDVDDAGIFHDIDTVSDIKPEQK